MWNEHDTGMRVGGDLSMIIIIRARASYSTRVAGQKLAIILVLLRTACEFECSGTLSRLCFPLSLGTYLKRIPRLKQPDEDATS